VQCLVKELGADVNQARLNGVTSLMVASAGKHTALTPRHSTATAARRLTSRKNMEPQQNRPRTWRRAHTALTPAATARGSRSAPAA
jgi:hypothetical protein